MTMVPIPICIGLMIYMVVISAVGAVRWSILALPKRPDLKDFWLFLRAGYLGAFYGLFFPSIVGGDLIKWLPLLKKYPDLSKTRLAGSIIVDRVVGFTAFAVMGLVALIVGKLLGYRFPDYLLWLFLAINAGVGVFFLLVYLVDFRKIIKGGRYLNKITEVIELIKKENRKKLWLCFLISVFAEPIWFLPIWLYSLIFKAGISLLEVYIFAPVINLALVLPISVAGFGAREQLYLFFFGQLGLEPEKILLVSTFGGIFGVLNSLLGGLLTLI